MIEKNWPEAAQQAGMGGQLGGIPTRRLDTTLRQNIDERIKQAHAVVAELEATKERMEKSGILDMRIDDIHRAMSW